MHDATSRRRRRPPGPLLIFLIVSASLASLGAGISSLAIWTDGESATGAFTAGTIDLALDSTTLFTATGIGPGQSGSAALVVSNSGSMALRYALTSSSTNADGLGLRAQLELTISSGACPGGTALFGPAALSGAAIGDPTQGADSGDRTLAAGAGETLCFAWSLPTSTGDAFQGAATTTTFTFAAEQTVANP